MKFAAIVPTSGLRVVERCGLGYHLVLAQYLLKDRAYRNYYKVLGRLGHFIIVDNGAAEHDTPPFEEVVRVANYISASEIVLPDKVHDRRWTLDATTDPTNYELVSAHKRFVVPQGETPDEVVDCLAELHKRLPFATFGLSKYHWQFEGGRPAILQLIIKRLGIDWLRTKNVHVLGIGCNPFKEITDLHKVYPGLRGIDTGAPVAWAQRHRTLPDPAWDGQHISLEWEASFSELIAKKNVLNLVLHAANPQVGSEATDHPLMGRFGY